MSGNPTTRPHDNDLGPSYGPHADRGHPEAAKLTSGERKKLPSSDFGIPGKKAYPMPDASHAANAKARATQQVKAGNLSPATAQKIDAKADKVLGEPVKHAPGSRGFK